MDCSCPRSARSWFCLLPFFRPIGTEWNYLMAASTISILPTAILTIALQKYIIEGISISGFGGR
jgi:multiple sugar transport system permease protein